MFRVDLNGSASFPLRPTSAIVDESFVAYYQAHHAILRYVNYWGRTAYFAHGLDGCLHMFRRAKQAERAYGHVFILPAKSKAEQMKPPIRTHFRMSDTLLGLAAGDTL